MKPPTRGSHLKWPKGTRKANANMAWCAGRFGSSRMRAPQVPVDLCVTKKIPPGRPDHERQHDKVQMYG